MPNKWVTSEKKEKKTDASEKGIIEAWYTDIVAATGFWITNEYKKNGILKTLNM